MSPFQKKWIRIHLIKIQWITSLVEIFTFFLKKDLEFKQYLIQKGGKSSGIALLLRGGKPSCTPIFPRGGKPSCTPIFPRGGRGCYLIYILVKSEIIVCCQKLITPLIFVVRSGVLNIYVLPSIAMTTLSS
jgi:hypothetical protein